MIGGGRDFGDVKVYMVGFGNFLDYLWYLLYMGFFLLGKIFDWCVFVSYYGNKWFFF